MSKLCFLFFPVLCRYFVGVYDRASKRVKLMHVPHVYSLKQRVKTYEPTVSTNKLEEVSWADKQKLLLTAFGSKLKKKQLRAKEAGAVDVSTVSSKAGKLIIILARFS